MTTPRESRAQASFRGGVTSYLALGFLINAVFLSSSLFGLFDTLPNTVMDVLTPLAVIAYWAFDPPRYPLPFAHCLLWLVFPACYVVYALAVGAATAWYPYYFFYPARMGGGYGGVLTASILLLLLAGGLGCAVVGIGRTRTSRYAGDSR